MPIYEVTNEHLCPLTETTFTVAGLRERADLQRLLRQQIEVISPDTLVISEEFGEWDDSRRRIDLLGVDRRANIVVIELKRTEDGGHMDLQAIRYAAMVSTMTFENAVQVYTAHLAKLGRADDARALLLDFLGWEIPDEDSFAQKVRIVLASADFSKELTTSALWLNDEGLDVRCVRMGAYVYGDKILLDVQQVIPLPEAEEYQVRVREKVSQERAAREDKEALEDRYCRFWSGLLEKANAVSQLHRNVSPSRVNWVATTSHGLSYSYVIAYGKGRVELYIQRAHRAENKALFDELMGHRADIERAFGSPLSWQRLDDKIASRVAADIDGGSARDESSWEELQDAMVDGMRRLEAALRPYVEEYRQGKECRPAPELGEVKFVDG